MDLGCGLKVELTDLADELVAGSEREDCPSMDGFSGLSNWGNCSVIY